MTAPASPARPVAASAGTIPIAGRRPPRLGAFNLTMLRIEVTRVMRNRRTLIVAVLLPVVLLLSFDDFDGWDSSAGHGNVAAYIMVSMGLYAAALMAAAAGASVSMERAQGWSRQLRLTPLHPVAYILVKAIVALVTGALAIIAVGITGAVQGHPQMPWGLWIACGLLTLVCTLVFAALGVFIGYLVPGENAMQFIGPGLAALGFLGNVFIPLTPGTVIYQVAEWTPMFGVAEISRWPLTGELGWIPVLNAVVWFALFVAGAAWRMSKDTARG